VPKSGQELSDAILGDAPDHVEFVK
jgi:hypothetical protein